MLGAGAFATACLSEDCSSLFSASATYQLGMADSGGNGQAVIYGGSLVVGFAMGFAIIPLIYTIADDALSSVPAHLRSASLGAGT